VVDIKEYFQIKNYTIKDGLISTDDNVNLIKKVKKMPVQFGQVGGYFDCYNNQLTSLVGCPESVGGYFRCNNNQLISLDGTPKSVDGDFYCANNQLTSLEGAPEEVGGYFRCNNNQLTSLVGAPQSGSSFDCANNKLISLEGAPKSVGGYFDCRNNPLISLEGAPKSIGGSFYLTWSKDLPLLRLVIYKSIETYNDQVNEIIRKYCNHKPLKEAILLCQKDLIDNGFIGNASW
jgi:aspartate carbamoyltransferase regulatory subunit